MLPDMLSTVLFTLSLALLEPPQQNAFSSVNGTTPDHAHRPALAPVRSIRAYADSHYEFRMAVPSTWQRIAMDEPVGTGEKLQSGYAVGFESPQSHAKDVFADYVMVEILPGSGSGAFASDGRNAEVIRIDGRRAVRETLMLDGFALHGKHINLVIYQAIMSGAGYEIGLYVIGEQREQPVLAEAFELLIQTFELDSEPYPVF